MKIVKHNIVYHGGSLNSFKIDISASLDTVYLKRYTRLLKRFGRLLKRFR